jgi:hypothetical protein
MTLRQKKKSSLMLRPGSHFFSLYRVLVFYNPLHHIRMHAILI